TVFGANYGPIYSIPNPFFTLPSLIFFEGLVIAILVALVIGAVVVVIVLTRGKPKQKVEASNGPQYPRT
ncbi:MAG TPA: hypothetical protein VJY36_03060, partial [Candidatus Bathyarchaeia archaeon]|nr:hypothetical protein [Candidatus Bathyarchaeia archaeon]